VAAVNPFQYSVLRAVPRVDRGEMINIGVVVYCQAVDFLDADVVIDDRRLSAAFPGVDVASVRTAGEAVVLACREATGSARENTGLAHRFGMLVAPRSTVVQPGPVHAGVTAEPAATLRRLIDRLVR